MNSTIGGLDTKCRNFLFRIFELILYDIQTFWNFQSLYVCLVQEDEAYFMVLLKYISTLELKGRCQNHFKGPLFEAKQIPKVLEVKGRGLLVSIIRTSKGQAIIFYCVKEYKCSFVT